MKRFLQFLGPMLGLAVLLISLVAVHHILKNYHFRDIATHLAHLPWYKQLLALGLAACSYLSLTLYDTLGVYSVKRPLPYRRIAMVSFIGYAFNNNFGFAGLAGNSLRYRIYTSWGLSTLEVAKIISYCVMAFWMGFLTVAGVAFLIDPVPLPPGLLPRNISTQVFGFLFLVPVLAYVVRSWFWNKPFTIGKWTISLPPLKITVAQIAIAGLDWAFVSLVFYCLLPDSGHISLPRFMGVFLLAQVAGLISHVPGGVGVFEAVVLLNLTSPALLDRPFGEAEVFATALAYRGFYYILPLGVAAVLLGFHEFVQRARSSTAGGFFARLVRKVKAVSVESTPVKLIGEWAPSLVPNVFTLAVFVAGAVLLFSGATPSVAERIKFLHTILPASLINTAHLAASMLGAGLLLVARGLYRRLDSAFVVAVALLAAGIPLSLLKGLDFEEAIILLVVLAAFIPCRSHFYRKAALITRFSITPEWAVAIGLTIAASIWLGFFSHNLIHPHRPWPTFETLLNDHARFLRATLGVIGVLALYGLKVVLSPARPQFQKMTEEDWQAIRSIVAASPKTSAWLAMLNDKRILFNSKRNAMIMYTVEGRSWVAMGDPVGPDEEKAELIWEFRELSDSHGGWASFYQVGCDNLPLYLDLGLALFKLGEEALVPLDNFTVQGQHNKGLRHTWQRLAREGFTFEIVEPSASAAIMPELKRISDSWLQAKHTPEKKFSVGFFSESYLKEFPLAIVRDSTKRIVAFANVWLSAHKEELSVDLMRHVPDLQSGMMDFLFVELMLWGRAHGWKQFNFGVAPLAGLENRALAPLWTRIGSLVFTQAEHLHHLGGLRQYKEKFHPSWNPVYLVCPGGMALPVIVANLTTIVAGGLRSLDWASGRKTSTPSRAQA